MNVIKKELNNKLSKSLFEVNYYYWVRNNKIVKIKKELDIEIDSIKRENRLKNLSKEMLRQKESINKVTRNSILAEEFRVNKYFF